MNQTVKMLPYLAVNAAMFYLLPLAIRNTGIGMIILLAGLPVLCLITAVVYGSKNPFRWRYPLFIALLFVPSIFLFYNDSAWPYSIVYGIIALAGELIGKLLHRRTK